MPCDTTPRLRGQTKEQRQKQVLEALKRLAAKLQDKSVKVVLSPQGAVAFVGWEDRDGVADVCAYRGLSVMKSGALARAVAEAETRQGRKVSPQAISQGFHSHDGGVTWSRH